jgi:hypothetical protein
VVFLIKKSLNSHHHLHFLPMRTHVDLALNHVKGMKNEEKTQIAMIRV